MGCRSIVRIAVALCFGLCIAAAPQLPAHAQAGKVWHIGLCHVGLDHTPPHLPALRAKLRELGYEEGKNLRLDFRNLADEAAAREAARGFVRDKVDLMVAFEDQCARAMKSATPTIPIVFAGVRDPIGTGFVRSLARPGGNVTGLNPAVVDMSKQIELFKELVPRLERLLVLEHPRDAVQRRDLATIHQAAAVLKLQLVERQASTPADVEAIFRLLDPGAVDGVVIASETLRSNSTSLLIRLASEHRVPLLAHRREWVAKGALFSYSPDIAASGADIAVYVDKILKGADPGGLPVAQPTRFAFTINLKAAKALNLAIPEAVVSRADEVIE